MKQTLLPILCGVTIFGIFSSCSPDSGRSVETLIRYGQIFSLLFASALTLLVGPVLYVTFFRIKAV